MIRDGPLAYIWKEILQNEGEKASYAQTALAVFDFPLGCSAGTEQPSTASGSDRQAELRERLDRVVDQQLAREHFSFSIILEDHSKYRFVGEQRGADWTLKSEGAGRTFCSLTGQQSEATNESGPGKQRNSLLSQRIPSRTQSVKETPLRYFPCAAADVTRIKCGG